MPPSGRTRLGRESRIVIDTLLPSGAHPRLSVGAIDSGFEDFLDEFEALGAPQLRRAFRWGLLTAAWGAPLLVHRRPPISRLPSEERTDALIAMERSNIPELRQLMRVVKTVLALHYGALPAVRSAIRYHA